jgi:amidophosphoribosyltransferase
MYAAVDPCGFHPLSIAPFETGVMVASETVAFDLFGIDPRTVRPIADGTIVDVGAGKVYAFAPATKPHHCSFEFGYFARPDSTPWGVSVSSVRERAGRLLAKSHPVKADVVISVPDSSNTQAQAYARAIGIPFGNGLIRSHYVVRTFTEEEAARGLKIRLKYNPDRNVVSGKRVVIIDDSIVRGLTMERVVGLVRFAGATEVHVLSATPRIIHPCYYGIDMQTSEELVAVGRSVEETRQLIGADSLGYLSLKDWRQALLDEKGERHCLTCFTGESPFVNIRR